MAKYEMGDQTATLFDKILDSDYNKLLDEQQMQELSELYRFEKGVIDIQNRDTRKKRKALQIRHPADRHILYAYRNASRRLKRQEKTDRSRIICNYPSFLPITPIP